MKLLCLVGSFLSQLSFFLPHVFFFLPAAWLHVHVLFIAFLQQMDSHTWQWNVLLPKSMELWLCVRTSKGAVWKSALSLSRSIIHVWWHFKVMEIWNRFSHSILNFRWGNNCCLYCGELLQQINAPLARNNQEGRWWWWRNAKHVFNCSINMSLPF